MGTTGIDIRVPMGLMFTILGAIITAYGVIQPKSSLSEGFNVNLDWGVVLLCFGIIMLLMGLRSRPGGKKAADEVNSAPDASGNRSGSRG